MDDWKKAAEEINPIGELGKKNGIQIGFHNHNMEFEKLEGELIYDVILDRMDPELIKLQFQVWVIIAGYKAADYFKNSLADTFLRTCTIGPAPVKKW
ncbi:MAG: hypothetical protein HC846_09650 [Blastocatellia bacterium]|nr:hypothetical protein [Blastocatellia bacterium]